MLVIILMILAVACFALDAFRIAESSRVNLTALGLLLWALSTLVGDI